MTRRIVASSAAALVLVALLANTGQAVTNTLFQDNFDNASNGTVASPSTALYNIGGETTAYSQLDYVYNAGGTVKLAKDGYGGYMLTTNLNVQAGTVRVEVDAIGYDADERVFSIAIGGASHSFSCSDDRASEPFIFDHVVQDFEVPAGVVQVAVSTTTSKRIVLDNLLVTQEVTESTDKPEFTVEMQSSQTVQELTPVSFTISASLLDNPVGVSYVRGLPAGASYSFVDGAFSWTPALGQEGLHGLVFSAMGSDSEEYEYTVAITVNALSLTAPANLAASNIGCEAFDLSWDAVPAATQGYVASVWTGSASPDTPNADMETFWQTTDDNPVQPLGWEFMGITLEYMDKGLNEISLNDTGDSVVTRWYPQAVTSLAFRAQTRSTTAVGDSELQVNASADGVTWTPVAFYTTATDVDGDDENNLFSVVSGDLDKRIALPAASGYRQFSFVYTKGKYNLGIGNIGAVYEGAGTKFVEGWNGAAVAGTGMVVNGVRPGRIYYALVGARNATETKFSQIALATLDAPPMTIIVVR